MHKKEYICTSSDENKRLDYVLKSVFTEYGTRAIKRFCEQNAVLVNEKAQKANYKVKAHDLLTIITPHREIINQEIHIITETDDFYLCYKEPFFHSEHQTGKNTLSCELLVHEKINPDYILLNRLDFATSGILVFAKNQHSALQWKAWQHEQKISKKYYALVEGIIFENKTIKNKIITDNYKNVKVSSEMGGRITQIRALGTSDTSSLVDCTIYQGARHQIRAHLSFLDYPLVGDKKYGAKTKDFTVLKNILPLSEKKPAPKTAPPFPFFLYELDNYQKQDETFCLHHYALICPEFSAFVLPPYFDILTQPLQNTILASYEQ